MVSHPPPPTTTTTTTTHHPVYFVGCDHCVYQLYALGPLFAPGNNSDLDLDWELEKWFHVGYNYSSMFYIQRRFN